MKNIIIIIIIFVFEKNFLTFLKDGRGVFLVSLFTYIFRLFLYKNKKRLLYI